MGRLVSRADLAESHAALRSEIGDPRSGLYGPETVAWRVSREAALFLGAGRAALLQLAHPFVAQAVYDHSQTRADPLRRFRATFLQMFRMAFGDLAEALRAGETVHRVHEHITGVIREDAGPFPARSAYFANDVDAQVWVLATLWDTSIDVFERCVERLSAAERDTFVREGRRTAMLFGIEREMPTTHAELRAYVDSMVESSTLTVTSAGREIGSIIMRPENLLGRAVRDDYGILTAWLLPERLATAFGLERGGSAGERRAARTMRIAKGLARRLPDHVRFVPGYLQALRRLRGDRGPDRVTRFMQKLYTGTSGNSPASTMSRPRRDA